MKTMFAKTGTFVSTIILPVFLLLAGTASAQTRNAERSETQLKWEARRIMSEVTVIPEGCKLSIVKANFGEAGRAVLFHMPMPDGWWALNEFPNVMFLDIRTEARLGIWRYDRVTPDWPQPFLMCAYYLGKGPGKGNDPQECVRLISLWLDGNRNYGGGYRDYYNNFRRACEKAGRDWMAVLDRELEKAVNPSARYEVRCQRAMYCEEKEEYEKALKEWEGAKAEAKDKEFPLFPNLYEMVDLEMAEIYLKTKDAERAEIKLRSYLSSTAGREKPFDPAILLGDLYMEQGRTEEAKALYEKVLDVYQRLGRGYESHIDNLQKRIALIGYAGKVSVHIERLGDDRHDVRKEAFNALLAMGKEIVPLLEMYKDHEDAEVRISVRTLIGKLR